MSRSTSPASSSGSAGMRRRWSPWLALILTSALACLPVPSAAVAVPGRAITQAVHRAWQPEDGLPQATVTALARSPDGYLWLGTQEGLARFDGVRFTVYDAVNTPAMASSWVTALAVGREHELWVGTREGLLLYRAGSLAPPAGAEKLAGVSITELVEDHDEALWISSDSGLFRLHHGSLTAFGPQEGMSERSVWAFLVRRNGSLWLGTEDGLYRRAPDGDGFRFAPPPIAADLGQRSVTALFEDADGALWVGLTDSELRRYGADGGPPAIWHPGTGDDFVSALAEDDHGRLWIGTEAAGLYRLDDGVLDHYGPEQGLIAVRVEDLLHDPRGNLWAGTGGGGLHLFFDPLFTPYGQPEGLPSDLVSAVVEDGAGGLWVGTTGAGLFRLAGGEVRRYGAAEGLPYPVVVALHRDAGGDLYIATERSGLHRLRSGRIEAVEELREVRFIRTLYGEPDGTLWVGGYGQLLRLDADGLRRYGRADGLPGDLVSDILRTSDSVLWIATYDGGAAYLEDDRLHRLTASVGDPPTRALTLFEDSSGALWLGTAGEGLSRVGDGRIITFDRRSGLADDNAFQILEDRGRRLWMSSNKGISRLAIDQIEELAAGAIDRVVPDLYGVADGMRSRECRGGFSPSGIRADDGTLWFSTVKGLVAVDPESAERRSPAPPVVIEETIADGAPLTLGPGNGDGNGAGEALPAASVPPGKGELTFRYTALELAKPQKIRFRVRLEPYDEVWIDAGSARVKHYTNLPPGDYRFRVGASYDDGPWSGAGEEAAMALRLRPHFHQTPLFFALGAAVLALAGWGGYRWRVHSLVRHNAELEARVAERTEEVTAANLRLREAREAAIAASRSKSEFLARMSHELRTPMNAVLGYTEMLLEEAEDGGDEQQASDLGKIRSAGRHLLSLINDVLDLSKIEAGKMELYPETFSPAAILEEVVETVRTLAKKNGNRLESRIEGDPGTVHTDLTKVRQTLINLLSNACKFTNEGTITVSARRATGDDGDAVLELAVSDTGIGMSREQIDKLFRDYAQAEASTSRNFGGTGLGLAICDRFCRMMGGSITVDSEPGRGTTFTVRLPVDVRGHAGDDGTGTETAAAV